GLENVEIIPTSGKPGVFGILNAGAAATVGIYFMYDVKQFDPAEWSSPPLEGRIVDKPGLGKVCMGRGAVNQKGPETAFLSFALSRLQARNCPSTWFSWRKAKRKSAPRISRRL